MRSMRLVMMEKETSGRARMHSHASARHASASGRKKSEVMQAYTCAPGGMAKPPSRRRRRGKSKSFVRATMEASRPTEASRR